MRYALIKAVLFTLFVVIPGFPNALAEQQEELSWPGDTWEVSSPEAEGLDAGAIGQLDAEIRSGKHGFIDSMLIVRSGRIVFEANYEHDYSAANAGRKYPSPPPWDYFNADEYPWRHGTRLHSLQSTTKSFMSALIGIAIARGDLPDTNITLGELLPHRNIDDPEKAAIRLENILTMTPGFEWNEDVSYFDPANDATAVEQLDDWVAYLLEKPLAVEQGTQYNYNSTNTQLMSEALTKVTGRPLDEYAEEYLFGPIGIDSYHWNDAPEGFKNVGGGLFLEPRDLARFALLYERGGEWKGKQVIPGEWVQRSRTPWVADMYPEDPDYDWGYGYQWWIFNHAEPGKPEMYGGWGWGGQFPLIVPELGLVAVFTGWNIYEEEKHEYAFRLFYDRVVLSADH
jgi:CubicO group peptidase (beta-lactamase class C family)